MTISYRCECLIRDCLALKQGALTRTAFCILADCAKGGRRAVGDVDVWSDVADRPASQPQQQPSTIKPASDTAKAAGRRQAASEAACLLLVAILSLDGNRRGQAKET